MVDNQPIAPAKPLASLPLKFADMLRATEGTFVQKPKVVVEEKEEVDDELLQYKTNFHSNKLFYRIAQNNNLTEVVDQEFDYYLGDDMMNAKRDFEEMLYDIYRLKKRRDLSDTFKRREKSYDLSQIAKYHSNNYYDLKGHVIRNRRQYGIEKSQ